MDPDSCAMIRKTALDPVGTCERTTFIKIALRTRVFLLLFFFKSLDSHLWNDSDAGSQIMESKISNVHPIYVNLSFCCLQDAENSQGQ